ncbi:hypothetical protein O9G_005077 [Rozella allomycis CSF55]|uniref:MULE transposase domain-containing protein n=1 Tax=Rozella allomycis (strain CSF55) TaxID=988480 RepID=A0A075B2D6_ROZAC|nr:hypothetical protein O9G_005077 [Rozella allomycis CSF55]|eukprot:EPZ36707.1 hypothetical protein O9G_005077 [Rozella allomycis CSF55]
MNEYVSAVGELELTSVAIKERILNESKSLGYALSVVRTDKNKIILACSRSKYPSCLARVRISTYKTEIGKIGLHVFEHNHPPSDKVTTLPDNVDDAIRSFTQAQMNSFQIHTAIQQIETEENTYTRIQVERDSLGTVLNFMWSDTRALNNFESTNCDLLLVDTTYKCVKFDQSLALFVSMDCHGVYYIVSAALISLEDARTFTWLINNLKSLCPKLGTSHTIIFTDNDAAMTLAFEGMAFLSHYLDLFYFLQALDPALSSLEDARTFTWLINNPKSVCPKLGTSHTIIVTDHDAAMTLAFEGMALLSHYLDLLHFVQALGRNLRCRMYQYENFRRTIRRHILCISSTELESEIPNLNYVVPILPKVCRKDRSHVFDLGVSGTNSCEAFNRVIKSYGANFASHALSLMQITDFIFDTYTEKYKSIIERKAQLVNVSNMSQSEKDLKQRLGAYAECKLLKQMRKAMFLDVVSHSDNCTYKISSNDIQVATVTLNDSDDDINRVYITSAKKLFAHTLWP